MQTGINQKDFKTGSRIVFSVIFAIALAILTSESYAEETNPHWDCSYCHVDYENSPKALRASVSRLCNSCHKDTVMNSSHPVNIVPQAMTVPSDLPLKNGKITCVTCHDIHGSATVIYGMKSYFLRRITVDIVQFCIVCHETNTSNPGHKELLATAHLGAKEASIGDATNFDTLSLACTGCHDGGHAQSVSMATKGDIASEHPVGMNYKTSQMRERSGLAPINKLNKRIHFFEGNVGCGTCHDAYSRRTSRLVMENDNSKLCTECHYDK